LINERKKERLARLDGEKGEDRRKSRPVEEASPKENQQHLARTEKKKSRRRRVAERNKERQSDAYKEQERSRSNPEAPPLDRDRHRKNPRLEKDTDAKRQTVKTESLPGSRKMKKTLWHLPLPERKKRKRPSVEKQASSERKNYQSQ